MRVRWQSQLQEMRQQDEQQQKAKGLFMDCQSPRTVHDVVVGGDLLTSLPVVVGFLWFCVTEEEREAWSKAPEVERTKEEEFEVCVCVASETVFSSCGWGTADGMGDAVLIPSCVTLLLPQDYFKGMFP